MVRRSRVLEEAERDADLPYEETRLAKRAVGARRRLFVLLLAGAAFAGVETALTRSAMVGLVAAALLLVAWRVRRGGLGGLIAAAFAGVMATLLPLVVWGVIGLGGTDVLLALAVVALGALSLPDLVTLIRDAELQHAYGLWARRE